MTLTESTVSRPTANWDDYRYGPCRSGNEISRWSRRRPGCQSFHGLPLYQRRGGDALGARLFERGRSGYTLTAAGEEMVALAVRMADDINGFERRIAGRDVKPSGELRVTTNDSIMAHLMMPIFSSFLTACPDIRLDIVVSNSPLNLSSAMRTWPSAPPPRHRTRWSAGASAPSAGRSMAPKRLPGRGSRAISSAERWIGPVRAWSTSRPRAGSSGRWPTERVDRCASTPFWAWPRPCGASESLGLAALLHRRYDAASPACPTKAARYRRWHLAPDPPRPQAVCPRPRLHGPYLGSADKLRPVLEGAAGIQGARTSRPLVELHLEEAGGVNASTYLRSVKSKSGRDVRAPGKLYPYPISTTTRPRTLPSTISAGGRRTSSKGTEVVMASSLSRSSRRRGGARPPAHHAWAVRRIDAEQGDAAQDEGRDAGGQVHARARPQAATAPP